MRHGQLLDVVVSLIIELTAHIHRLENDRECLHLVPQLDDDSKLNDQIGAAVHHAWKSFEDELGLVTLARVLLIVALSEDSKTTGRARQSLDDICAPDPPLLSVFSFFRELLDRARFLIIICRLWTFLFLLLAKGGTRFSEWLLRNHGLATVFALPRLQQIHDQLRS